MLLERSFRSESSTALVTIESGQVGRRVADVVSQRFFRFEDPVAVSAIECC